ncbi:hypothetical protein [Nocardia sp. NPDC003979]
MTKSIDSLLDDGAPGLQYFEQLGPRYVAAFGGSFDFYELVRPYDNERQMNITKLDAAAVAVRQLLTTADAEVAAQQSAAQSMQSGWQGAAAEAAAAQLGRVATMAGEDRDAVRNFEVALTAAAAQIPELVKAKADTVLKLTDGSVERYIEGAKKALPSVGGLSPHDIDCVIFGSKNGRGLMDEQLSTITTHRNAAGVIDVPDTRAGLDTSSSDYTDAIKQICTRWLSIVFMPDYNQKVQIFRDQCTTTRIAIEALFTAVETAAAGVVERGYPSVSGSGNAPVEDKKTQEDPSKTEDKSTAKGNEDNSGGGQSADAGGQTSAAATQTGDTSAGSTAKTTTETKETTEDSTTDDSDSSTALTSIASTMSSLATTVSDALTGDLGSTLTSSIESVGTSIGDGIEQLTEQASSLLAEGGQASFQLGDTAVSIEAGANGLSLTTTDASGATSQYTLSLNENGIPVLTQESDSSAGAPEDESSGVLGSGTPQSGTGEGEAGADAGSETSAPDATGPDTPDLTDAPVTSEIGSGEESSGSVAGGVPVAPRPAGQETDGEHVPSVDLPVSDPGDSGAVLAEAGPL